MRGFILAKDGQDLEVSDSEVLKSNATTEEETGQGSSASASCRLLFKNTEFYLQNL